MNWRVLDYLDQCWLFAKRFGGDGEGKHPEWLLFLSFSAMSLHKALCTARTLRFHVAGFDINMVWLWEQAWIEVIRNVPAHALAFSGDIADKKYFVVRSCKSLQSILKLRTKGFLAKSVKYMTVIIV